MLIVEAAIELMDREGEAGLTLRRLAEHFGSGLGSVYWHVESKQHLINLAIDTVLGQALATADTSAAEPARADPSATALGEIRHLCLALFDQIMRHRWIAVRLATDADVLENGLEAFDRIGRQLLHLELTTRQQFHAATALLNYLSGVGAAMATHHRFTVDERPPEPTIDEQLGEWLSGERPLPFLAAVRDEFSRSDPSAEFEAGLDLILAGIRQLAE